MKPPPFFRLAAPAVSVLPRLHMFLHLSCAHAHYYYCYCYCSALSHLVWFCFPSRFHMQACSVCPSDCSPVAMVSHLPRWRTLRACFASHTFSWLLPCELAVWEWVLKRRIFDPHSPHSFFGWIWLHLILLLVFYMLYGPSGCGQVLWDPLCPVVALLGFSARVSYFVFMMALSPASMRFPAPSLRRHHQPGRSKKRIHDKQRSKLSSLYCGEAGAPLQCSSRSLRPYRLLYFHRCHPPRHSRRPSLQKRTSACSNLFIFACGPTTAKTRYRRRIITDDELKSKTLGQIISIRRSSDDLCYECQEYILRVACPPSLVYFERVFTLPNA